MEGLRNWLRDRLRERPWWMNVLMLVCAYMTFIYLPWDFFLKPVSRDEEVWVGIVLRGPAAKLTEPLHWAIYAAGTYGFWKMRPWMWPWAAIYTATISFGMLVWGLLYQGGFTGLFLGGIGAGGFALITRSLWRASDWFSGVVAPLHERYGRWALVTGASAGIGAEFARALAREVCSVVLVARRRERLEALAQSLEGEYGVETRVIPADLACQEGIDTVEAAVKDLDIAVLVNNAGAGYAGAFAKQELIRLRSMVALNCSTTIELTHRLLGPMLTRGRGAVIIVASVAGRQPVPLHAVYSATKAFDLLFGEALWVELREYGIDVVVLQPGPVASEFEQVAGECRPDPTADEQPQDAVRYALDALGRQPSVVSGGTLNWLRANANRVLPRSVVAFVARDFMARQTPADMQ